MKAATKAAAKAAVKIAAKTAVKIHSLQLKYLKCFVQGKYLLMKKIASKKNWRIVLFLTRKVYSIEEFIV